MIVYTPTTAPIAGRSASTAGPVWLLLAGSHAALLVDAAAAAPRPITDRVGELYAAVQSEGAIRAVLDRLTVGGLSDVPSFVLASWNSEGTLHLLVRGAGTVVVETLAGTEKIDSSAVSTWVERVISGARSVRAGDAAAADGASEGTADGASDGALGGSLPLGAGVVWASSIVVEIASAVRAFSSTDAAIMVTFDDWRCSPARTFSARSCMEPTLC